MLYLPTDEVKRVADGLSRADALLETLVADPSLRGTLDALSLGLTGVERKEVKLDDMTRSSASWNTPCSSRNLSRANCFGQRRATKPHAIKGGDATIKSMSTSR